MKEVCILVFLAVNAWTDWKKQQIILGLAVAFGVFGAVWTLWHGRELWDLAACGGIGLIFLTLSFLSSGAVGIGDSILLLALGMVMPVAQLLTALCLGLLLAAIFSAGLMVLFHKGRHTEIPFVPFLLLGYTGGLCLW